MASEKKIRERLLAILKEADLNVTTGRSVRKQLEEEFGCSLADKKEFIRKEVANFLRARQEEGEEGEEDAAEDDDEADEEPAPTKKRRGRKPKEEKPEKKKRTGSGGLNKVCTLSPQLSELLGVTEMPRTQVVKEVWVYIREHNLQDPENKRKINCDEAMQNILGTKRTDMFQMNKLLSQHIFSKPGPNGETTKEKKPKGEGGGAGFTVEQPLSRELQEFLGTGETHLPRQEVVKRMWTYIKEHSLQNPADRRTISCDDKLQKLFGVESFNGFGITKLLVPHIGVKAGEAASLPDQLVVVENGGRKKEEEEEEAEAEEEEAAEEEEEDDDEE